jgi:hypothetical protein
MSRFRGRTATSKQGFVPSIVDSDDERVQVMLDNAYVEYGTGCWLDNGTVDTHLTYDLQCAVYEHVHGEVPEGEYVVNACSDYRVCYNPNCLITVDLADLEFTH